MSIDPASGGRDPWAEAPPSVRDFLSSTTLQLLPQLIAPTGVPDPRMLGDLLELWVVAVGWMAEAAARRRHPDDLNALEAVVQRLEQGEGDLQEADLRWLVALAKATDNRVLQLLAGAFREVIANNRGLFAPLYASRWYDASFHRRTLEAMQRQDPIEAGKAARDYGRRTCQALGLSMPKATE